MATTTSHQCIKYVAEFRATARLSQRYVRRDKAMLPLSFSKLMNLHRIGVCGRAMIFILTFISLRVNARGDTSVSVCRHLSSLQVPVVAGIMCSAARAVRRGAHQARGPMLVPSFPSGRS